MLEQLSQEISRLLEAHTRWRAVTIDEFDRAMAEASERKQALQDSLLAVNVALQSMPEPETRARQLRELATDIAPILDSPDIEEANAWLSKRIKAVWCQGNKVEQVELA